MKTTVKIELDKIRYLRFDVNAMIEVEELIGKPVTALDSEELGMKGLRSVLYAGLKWESPKLTLREAGDMMSAGLVSEGLDYLVDTLGDALMLGLGVKPEDRGDEEKN
jgi:hypothetical protein